MKILKQPGAWNDPRGTSSISLLRPSRLQISKHVSFKTRDVGHYFRKSEAWQTNDNNKQLACIISSSAMPSFTSISKVTSKDDGDEFDHIDSKSLDGDDPLITPDDLEQSVHLGAQSMRSSKFSSQTSDTESATEQRRDEV